MGKFIFQAVIGLVIFGTIFGLGVLVGGGFGTGLAEEDQAETVEACLPLDNTQQLEECLQAEDEP